MIEMKTNTTLLEQFQHMIEINKTYHTVGTVPTYDRNKQKYHTVGTVPTYDRNKQKIPQFWNSSNIR